MESRIQRGSTPTPTNLHEYEKKRVVKFAFCKCMKRKNESGSDQGRGWVPFAHTAQGEPEWEEYPHTPGVFVRVRNKGDKSGQRTGMLVRPKRTIAVGRKG